MRKREGLSLVHSYLDGDGGGVGVGVGALEYQPIGGTPGRPPAWNPSPCVLALLVQQMPWGKVAESPCCSGFRLSLNFGLSVGDQLISSLLCKVMPFIFRLGKCSFIERVTQALELFLCWKIHSLLFSHLSRGFLLLSANWACS